MRYLIIAEAYLHLYSALHHLILFYVAHLLYALEVSVLC